MLRSFCMYESHNPRKLTRPDPLKKSREILKGLTVSDEKSRGGQNNNTGMNVETYISFIYIQ